MAKTLSKTLTHGDFASVFQEVQQPETVGWTTEGELRLFHLVIRNNKINVDDLKAYLYTSMGDYVFSRAKLEKFSQAGNRDAVVSQALRILKKNGGADVQGTPSKDLTRNFDPSIIRNNKNIRCKTHPFKSS